MEKKRLVMTGLPMLRQTLAVEEPVVVVALGRREATGITNSCKEMPP